MLGAELSRPGAGRTVGRGLGAARVAAPPRRKHDHSFLGVLRAKLSLVGTEDAEGAELGAARVAADLRAVRNDGNHAVRGVQRTELSPAAAGRGVRGLLLVTSRALAPLDDQVDHPLLGVSGAEVGGLAAWHAADRLAAAARAHAPPVDDVDHPALFVRTAELSPAFFAAGRAERRLLVASGVGAPLQVGDVQHSFSGVPGAELRVPAAELAGLAVRRLLLAARTAALLAKDVRHPFPRVLRAELQFFRAGDAVGGALAAARLGATLPVQVGHATRGVLGAALGLLGARHTERGYLGAVRVVAFLSHFPATGVSVFRPIALFGTAAAPTFLLVKNKDRQKQQSSSSVSELRMLLLLAKNKQGSKIAVVVRF